MEIEVHFIFLDDSDKITQVLISSGCLKLGHDLAQLSFLKVNVCEENAVCKKNGSFP